jgi:hypothetical protein
MPTHFDPEGNASVLTDYSALSLTIPAEQSVHLYASFDSAWEQAVVLFIDGERYEGQLGSYILRPTVLTIPKREASYELTLVAWHKRSNPSALDRLSSPGTTRLRMAITATCGSSSLRVKRNRQGSFTHRFIYPGVSSKGS